MDQKQLDALQTAVQWVVDYQRWKTAESDGVTPTLGHSQGYWGLGKVGAAYEGKLNIREEHDFLVGMKPTMLCTSACCLAGDVVLNNGDQMVAFDADRSTPISSTDWCVDTKGNLYSIPLRAQGILGITEGEAELMFSGSNTPDDIVRYATEIARGYGHELEIV